MKLKKIRNALLVVLTLALVSATAVAVTWAAKGAFDAVDNDFDNAEIDVAISEYNWDGKKSTWSTTSGTANPDPAIAADTATLGKNIAKAYNQTSVIPKDPVVENTSSAESEYVAMSALFKVKFTINGTKDANWRYISYSQFTTSIATLYKDLTGTTAGINNKWTAGTTTNTALSKTVDYFVYSDVLAKEQKASQPLFGSVIVNKPVLQSSGANAGKYMLPQAIDGVQYIDDLPEFDIVLTGFAVQADSVNASTAASELASLVAAAPTAKIDA